MKNIQHSGLRWLGLTGVIVFLDHITKYLAIKHLVASIAYPIFPGLNLTLSFNTGAAFGFLNESSGWQEWFFGGIAVIVSLALLVWLYRLSHQQYRLCIGLSFIIGGAWGNVYDRVMAGQVTDFIQVYVSHFYWPTFNLADSAICIGAALLLISGRRL